jgi:Rad3-related DNA helicase
MDYYDRERYSGAGDSWYTYDAMTAVNQGVGRGIRDPRTDYCRVFLLDARYIYREAEIFNRLSGWIRDNVVSGGGAPLASAEERTTRFFEKLGDLP